MEVKLTSAFTTSKEKSYRLLRDFFTYDMNIKKIEIWDCDDKLILAVPEKKYNKCIIQGQKFILENNIKDIFWLDHYASAIECGYLQIACGYIDLLNNKQDSINQYINNLRDYTNTNIKSIPNNNDNYIKLLLETLDYNNAQFIFQNFIDENLFGPFINIKKVAIDGKIENNYKIRKKC